MSKLLNSTRYLILVPIVGLALAAASFFVFGGIGLISLLLDLFRYGFGNLHAPSPEVRSTGMVIYEVVEHVHTFLVGTVLYITAVGLYQLFIHRTDFPGWLKVDSVEELETNLIGVTVVVLAVHFMGAIFAEEGIDLVEYGAGIALPIAALGVFIGLRAWASKVSKQAEALRPTSSQAGAAVHPETDVGAT